MMTGNNVGVVHQMPYCCDMSGFSGQFEKVFFGTFSKNFMFINFVGLNFIYGMSCLFRKHVIDECGGLIHFGQYMSEDYFIAKAFYDK
jgi:ceramide glucosyltransferase